MKNNKRLFRKMGQPLLYLVVSHDARCSRGAILAHKKEASFGYFFNENDFQPFYYYEATTASSSFSFSIFPLLSGLAVLAA